MTPVEYKYHEFNVLDVQKIHLWKKKVFRLPVVWGIEISTQVLWMSFKKVTVQQVFEGLHPDVTHLF